MLHQRKHATLLALATLSAAAALPVMAAVAPNPGGATVYTNSTTTSYQNVTSTVTVNNYQAQVLGFETLSINSDFFDIGGAASGAGQFGPSSSDTLVTQFNQAVPDATQTVSLSSSTPPTAAELSAAYSTVSSDVQNSIDSLAESIIGIPGRNDLMGGDDAAAFNSTNADSGPASSSTAQTSSTTTVTPTTTRTDMVPTVTSTMMVGPGSVMVGDNQSDTFYVTAGQTDFNVNTDTQYYQDVVTTNTDTTTDTYDVMGYKVVSPIVLNLDGTGKLEASDGVWQPHPKQLHMSHRVLFDFYGNGFPVAMEWVGPKDGLLCQPKADGTVDGTSLFGTSTGYANGFEQLASLDSNMDGHLSGRELDSLRVWRDTNGNGKVDPGELSTLKELGITDLNLRNRHSKASFLMHGKSCAMFDWWPTVLEIKKIKKGSV